MGPDRPIAIPEKLSRPVFSWARPSSAWLAEDGPIRPPPSSANLK